MEMFAASFARLFTNTAAEQKQWIEIPNNHEFSEDFKKIAGHVLVVKKYKRKIQAFLNGSNSQFAELKRILEASCERPLKFRGPKQI